MRTDDFFVSGSRVRTDLNNEWGVGKNVSSHFQEAGSPGGHVIALIQKLHILPLPCGRWVENIPIRPCSNAIQLWRGLFSMTPDCSHVPSRAGPVWAGRAATLKLHCQWRNFDLGLLT